MLFADGWLDYTCLKLYNSTIRRILMVRFDGMRGYSYKKWVRLVSCEWRKIRDPILS